MNLHKISGPNLNFEDIKHVDENNVEFWTGRELFPLLGYARWDSFVEVIKRAIKAAINSGQIPENHFRQLTKMVEIGSNSQRSLVDWKLDRYACYLIAQNGDSKIVPIALAQTYFAVQSRRQEVFENLSDSERRVFIRGEVANENKKLFQTAKKAGVSNFGLFNDAGYRGLYGFSLSGISSKKGIKKNELLDTAGSSELAANLFRITQTDDKIKKDNIQNELDARKAHFMVGGKVRQTIRDIGGELPENLKPEKHIKEIKKEIRRLEKDSREKMDQTGKKKKLT